MYKNPSFFITLEVIKNNVEKNNRENMTVACIIDQSGTMFLYDSVRELFTKSIPSPFPDEVKSRMLVQYLVDTDRYFFHESYEFIPAQLPTPEMEARIMQWKEALLCLGIELTPATTRNYSGRSLHKPSEITLHLQENIDAGNVADTQRVELELERLKDFSSDVLIDRYDYEHGDVPAYCIKIDTPKKLTPDPCIIFKDSEKRPAVVRKPLHDFIDVYASYMTEDDNFEVFVYPDGTAANMTGYSSIELDSEISDKNLEEYILAVKPPSLAADIINRLNNGDENLKFLYKLQILRIVCIVGIDTYLLPYPITPQQSVFLEGLQEFNESINFNGANIKVLKDVYNCNPEGPGHLVPLSVTNGFILGGAQYFCSYSQLSPTMKRRVDKAMNLKSNERSIYDQYLFDASSEDHIFVIESGAAL